MYAIFKTVIAPLLSLFTLVMGNGLFSTLITLRLHEEGTSALMIGVMTSVYYCGFVFAAYKSEGMIRRVGHIRAFSAFASSVAVISLLQGIFVNPWFWLFLRFLSGVSIAGLFIVIESWLLVLGTATTRGQILALYMVSLYGGQASGQFLINLGSPSELLLFAVTAMLSSLAVIPLALTRIGSPQFDEAATLGVKKLYKKCASGVAGCFASGLILSAIYGLLPLYVVEKNMGNSVVALFMALVILGGMALQYPVGRVSDYIERRSVLIAIALLTVGCSAIMIYAFHWYWLALVATFVFGGLCFTLYPVSISHACDSLDNSEILAGTQGLLLAYSIGAALGPFVAPLFMREFGPNGLFFFFVLVSSLLGAFVLWRRVQVAPTAQEEPFMLAPQTTPVATELDPRSEE